MASIKTNDPLNYLTNITENKLKIDQRSIWISRKRNTNIHFMPKGKIELKKCRGGKF